MINKQKLNQIVFNSDTKTGQRFDILLLWSILISILVAILDSLPTLGENLKLTFYILEWLLTIIFTIEYILRIVVSKKPASYIFSFWGAVDFLAVFPTYVSLFIVGYHYLIVVRMLRLMRVFRILRLVRFYSEAILLLQALKASFYKISIFFATVLTTVVLLGTIMYVIEGEKNGFSSIPQGIYWAIITITTVGYGDIVPVTVLGKMISSIAMIIGYAIIAVPTGIVTVEMARANEIKTICPNCNAKNDTDATFCKKCGIKLNQNL